MNAKQTQAQIREVSTSVKGAAGAGNSSAYSKLSILDQKILYGAGLEKIWYKENCGI